MHPQQNALKQPKWLFIPLLLLSLAACTEMQLASSEHGIVGGHTHSGDPAVVLLDLGPLGGYCTGTLISPKVVITAAHCLDRPEEMEVRTVNDADDEPAHGTRVVQHGIPNGTDLGIVAMVQAIDATAPIPWNKGSLKAAVGQPVRLVGFGATGEEETDFGVKREGNTVLDKIGAQIKGVKGDEMATSNRGGQGTCYGDSGGPNFMTIDGVEQLVATTSRGTDACGAGVDVAVRTDAHRAFIADFIAANDPDACLDPGTCERGAPDDGGGGGCQTGGGAGGLWLLGLFLLLRGRRAAAVLPLCALLVAGCNNDDPVVPPPSGDERATPVPAPTETSEEAPAEQRRGRETPAAQASDFIDIPNKSNLEKETLEILKIVRKPELTAEEDAKVKAWKDKVVKGTLEEHLDQECTTAYTQRYQNAPEREKERLRKEWVESQAGRDILLRKTEAVAEKVNLRIANNQYFESELLLNAMYMAERQARAVRQAEGGRPIPEVEKVIRRCADRINVDISRYRDARGAQNDNAPVPPENEDQN